MKEYLHLEVEPKWQKYWDEHNTFYTDTRDFSKPKYYALDMFPYPSGHGLHVGHPEGYTATDILSRMKRMQGYNVLHPMGWDAFGLPAEQYAVITGNHPDGFTRTNIETFKRQLKMLGFSYDWSKEISTCDPEYYKWTQWIFIELYKKGLARLIDMPVNWCEELGTVLANDEVIDGKSERGGYPVVRKNMKQWVLDIPEYADRLIEGLNNIDWPESTKEIQRNWIGKSVGAHVDFKVNGTDKKFTVFTTRCDTLFGATYCVLSPEHELVDLITTDDKKEEVKYAVFTNCILQPEGDMTRFIRQLKSVASSNYLDEFVEKELEIAERAIDNLPEVGEVNKEVINKLRKDEDTKRELRKTMDIVTNKAKASATRDKPNQILLKKLTNEQKLEIEEHLSNLESLIIKLREAINE